jgi:hypothetical protein
MIFYMNIIMCTNNRYSRINKPNNHISPELTEHKKGTMTYDVGNPGSVLGQAHKYGGVRMN